jgi:GWxTD domain-containing protein
MIRRLFPLALMLAASVLAADGLSVKYRSWDKSPEAYFLTSDERTQWKQVKTDEEAEKFVAAYFARRSPDLPKMLKDRVAVADKYFSAGSVKGSETLRGKVVIVFGPPSAINVVKARDAKGRPLGTSGDVAYAGSGGADPLTNVGPGASGIERTVKEDPIFEFTYDEKAAPKSIAQVFNIDVRMRSAAKQEALDAQDLNVKFEKVAKDSIVK